jgi:hypothetical protein
MKAYAVAIAANNRTYFSFSVMVLPDCESLEDAREQGLEEARRRWPDALTHEAAIASISGPNQTLEGYPQTDVWV